MYRIGTKLLTESRGFTLIEIVIIITVLGIVAAVAVPSYKDMQIDAKSSGLRASLASAREAISIWHAAAKTRGDAGEWPALDSIAVPNVVLTHPFPSNPFQGSVQAPDSVVEGFVRGQIEGDRGGWAFKPSTGEIWPNTNTLISGSGCSGSQQLNENTW